ncbi:MAG TPA: N-acetyltransferase family protein [Devosia sp.]|nr:N-acetyltransferase family protein [Devosia sp.]
MNTNQTDIILRPYLPDDAAQITDIYAHYVNNTVISFDLEAPDKNYMQEKFTRIQQAGHPLITAQDKNGIVGYAYASTYRTRPAYRFTCENAIYLHPDRLGKGVGSRLLERLLIDAKGFGFNQMIAIISMGAGKFSKNTAGSIALHKKFGFKVLGEFPELGYKFDQWHGMTHLQRKL